jgi:hypothetical protein
VALKSTVGDGDTALYTASLVGSASAGTGSSSVVTTGTGSSMASATGTAMTTSASSGAGRRVSVPWRW